MSVYYQLVYLVHKNCYQLLLEGEGAGEGQTLNLKLKLNIKGKKRKEEKRRDSCFSRFYISFKHRNIFWRRSNIQILFKYFKYSNQPHTLRSNSNLTIFLRSVKMSLWRWLGVCLLINASLGLKACKWGNFINILLISCLQFNYWAVIVTGTELQGKDTYWKEVFKWVYSKQCFKGSDLYDTFAK